MFRLLVLCVIGIALTVSAGCVLDGISTSKSQTDAANIAEIGNTDAVTVTINTYPAPPLP